MLMLQVRMGGHPVLKRSAFVGPKPATLKPRDPLRMPHGQETHISAETRRQNISPFLRAHYARGKPTSREAP